MGDIEKITTNGEERVISVETFLGVKRYSGIDLGIDDIDFVENSGKTCGNQEQGYWVIKGTDIRCPSPSPALFLSELDRGGTLFPSPKPIIKAEVKVSVPSSKSTTETSKEIFSFRWLQRR
jgi:hypothetical protein